MKNVVLQDGRYLPQVEIPDACVWGKHSAWTSTAKMAAPVPHRPCAHAGTISGRSPNPLFIERRNILGRLQSEKISLHVTPEEKKAMVERMKEAVSPSMRAFILDMCMNGKIIASAPRNIVPL